MKLSISDHAAYWNKRAIVDKGISGSLWQNRTIWNWYIDSRHRDVLRPWFSEIKPGQSVLDVGCGVGRFVKSMTRRTRMTGIDISPECVRRCKDIAPSSLFFVGSATYIKLPPDAFDWVFSITTLCCITDRSEFINAMGEIVRVLKPGGRAIFLEHLDPDNKSEMIVDISPVEFILMIKQYGLKIETWEGFDVPEMRWILEIILSKTPSRLLKELVTLLYLPLLWLTETALSDNEKFCKLSKYQFVVVRKEKE